MQHRTPIAAILSALNALKNGGAALLKKPGGALRAFIGAGFCVVILSLSACASKGAADIPIGGGGNVGDGGGGEMPRELVELPAVSNTETLSGLNDLATSMTPDASAIRSGGVPVGFGPITERQYDFIDSSIIVQQLEFAHLGVWMDGDVADDTLRYRYANLNDNNIADNIPATPPEGAIGTATYNVEVDAFFDGLRFYPDGELTADFGTGELSGVLSAIGDDANRDDDFGVGATLPDGSSPDATDILSLFVNNTPNSIRDGAFSIVLDSSSPISGFFASLDPGTGTFDGRFHDAADYDGTTAPAEFSGTFTYNSNTGTNISGGFLGECATNC